MRYITVLVLLLAITSAMAHPGLDPGRFPVAQKITAGTPNTPGLWPYSIYIDSVNNTFGDQVKGCWGLYKRSSFGVTMMIESRCFSHDSDLLAGSRPFYTGCLQSDQFAPIPLKQDQYGNWYKSGKFQAVFWVRDKNIPNVSWDYYQPAFGYEITFETNTATPLDAESLTAMYDACQPTEPGTWAPGNGVPPHTEADGTASPGGDPPPVDPDNPPASDSTGFFGSFWETFVNAMKSMFIPSEATVNEVKSNLHSLWYWGPVCFVDSLIKLKDETPDAPPKLEVPIAALNVKCEIPLNPFGDALRPLRTIMGGIVWLAFAFGLAWYFMPKQTV